MWGGASTQSSLIRVAGRYTSILTCHRPWLLPLPAATGTDKLSTQRGSHTPRSETRIYMATGGRRARSKPSTYSTPSTAKAETTAASAHPARCVPCRPHRTRPGAACAALSCTVHRRAALRCAVPLPHPSTAGRRHATHTLYHYSLCAAPQPISNTSSSGRGSRAARWRPAALALAPTRCQRPRRAACSTPATSSAGVRGGVGGGPAWGWGGVGLRLCARPLPNAGGGTAVCKEVRARIKRGQGACTQWHTPLEARRTRCRLTRQTGVHTSGSVRPCQPGLWEWRLLAERLAVLAYGFRGRLCLDEILPGSVRRQCHQLLAELLTHHDAVRLRRCDEITQQQSSCRSSGSKTR